MTGREAWAAYIADTYSVDAETPWAPESDHAVFRHRDNRKWFAVLMGNLSVRCLGLSVDGIADVLNLKCDPLMTFSLIDNQKIFRAYHMNKEHWISVHLDSGITLEELAFLIDLSYGLVDQKGKSKPAKE